MDKLLLVSQEQGDYTEIISRLSAKFDLVWLQLWPVVSNPELDILVNTTENITNYLSNNEILKIGKEAIDISANWWKLVGYKIVEPQIDNVSVSTIFSYELERTLLPILFNISVIEKSIKKHDIDRMCIINNKCPQESSYAIFKDLPDFKLSTVYATDSRFIDNLLIEEHHGLLAEDNILKKAEALNKDKLSFLITNKLRKIFPQKKSIVISKTLRCNDAFFNIVSKTYPCVIYPTKAIVTDQVKTTWEVDSLEELIFNTVSLRPLFKLLLPNIEKEFLNLIEFYHKTKKYITKTVPRLYLTVEISSSLELVKYLAFKRMGVKSVCTPEGVTVLHEALYPYLHNFYRPNIDIERWVTSELNALMYTNNKENVTVTGMLSSNINSNNICCNKELSNKIQILFPLSMTRPHITGLTFGENIFEILKCIKSVCETIKRFDNIELTFRLHPGDKESLPLYREATSYCSKILFDLDSNINDLIIESDLVIIYDTSVGLEAILKNKNLIVYNYTGRENYSSQLDKYINTDPCKGVCVKMTSNEDELEMAIDTLIKYRTSNVVDDEKYRIIWNGHRDYDIQKVVSTLLH